MSLFKTGDDTYDQYARYTIEQLIEIVKNNDHIYLPGQVETARKVLIARGHDFRTPEQKRADKEQEFMQKARERDNAAATRPFATPRVRINRPVKPASGGSGVKAWHWILIALILVRMIGCLLKNGH